MDLIFPCSSKVFVPLAEEEELTFRESALPRSSNEGAIEPTFVLETCLGFETDCACYLIGPYTCSLVSVPLPLALNI